ncbi:MAG: GCN5-related N-acetyltransferase [Frankiales bacterium]|nr:GCN5-related N-acetyltransferase [Frankiales bacterium]
MPTPELTFRLAVHADAPILSALVQSAYRGDDSRVGWTTEADLLDGDRVTTAHVEELIAGGQSAVLVALDEQDEIIGCCEVQLQAAGLAYFGMFAVQPSLQSAGVGRVVLAEAEAYARQRWQATAMEMTVIAQREELIAWYERRGYTVTDETRPFPYEDVNVGVASRTDLYFRVLRKTL